MSGAVRRVGVKILIASMLIALSLIVRSNPRAVEASPEAHQGDVVLSGNNVTVIEDRFAINGSIIVEENATLVLRNASLNFTQLEDNQHNMTLWRSANGQPRLVIDNATITGSGHRIPLYFFDNSSASIEALSPSERIAMHFLDYSTGSVSNSDLESIWASRHSEVNVSSSTVSQGVNGYDFSTVRVSSCTLLHIYALYASSVEVVNTTLQEDAFMNCYNVNCTIDQLEPGFVIFWSLDKNCTVETLLGSAPNLTLVETHVEGWNFRFEERSNVTISDSRLLSFSASDQTSIQLHNCSLDGSFWLYSAKAHLRYSYTAGRAYILDYSQLWLTNSSIEQISIISINAQIIVLWYIDVHVIDTHGSDVPGANVTALYPNATLAESGTTDEDGWATLELIEKTVTSCCEYPIGNYTIKAVYKTYQNQTTANVTENLELALKLEGFIIPELTSLITLPFLALLTLLVITARERRKQLS